MAGLQDRLARYHYRYAPLLPGPSAGGGVRVRWGMPSSRLLMRYGLVIAAAVFLYLMRLHIDARAELRAVYAPTRFINGAGSQAGTQRYAAEIVPAIREYDWSPYEGAFRTDRPALRERWMWKVMGYGFEGDVFAINDTAIKTFITSRSPLRNCVPAAPLGGEIAGGAVAAGGINTDVTPSSTRWPTQIPAALLLAGMMAKTGDDENATAVIDDKSNFVPVKDYFLTPTSHWGRLTEKWHLLTPLLKGGDLDALADRLRAAGAYSYRDLDAMFRPSFNRLLEALETMHTEYGLCHDDLRSDNVFVADYSAAAIEEGQLANAGVANSHWLLGDLGTVRELVHPMHSTAIWNRWSGQYGDCRRNDVVRLVKTYLQFLRSASSPSPTAVVSSPTSASSTPSSTSAISPASTDSDWESTTTSSSTHVIQASPEDDGHADIATRYQESDGSWDNQGRHWSFDGAFFAGTEPWAQLYWAAVHDPLPGSVAAASMLEKSTNGSRPFDTKDFPSSPASSSPSSDGTTEGRGGDLRPPIPPPAPQEVPEFGGVRCWFVRGSCRGKAVDELLRKGMRVTQTRARWLAWTWVIGVPVGDC